MAPVTKSERNKNEIQEKQNLGSPLHFNLVTFNENFFKNYFFIMFKPKTDILDNTKVKWMHGYMQAQNI